MGFWSAVERVLGFPTYQRFETIGPQDISGLNDPNASMYQALTGALDSMGGMGGYNGSMPGLPSLGMDQVGRVSALYLAVALTCSTIAGLPLQTFDENGDERAPVKDPRQKFLWRRPNAEETRQEYWETVLAHRMLGGDAFMYVDRTRLGDPGELQWIYPTRMQVGQDKQTMRKIYVLDGNTDQPMVTANRYEGEIVHVRNLTWGRQGLRGMGLVQLARMGIGIEQAAQQYGARFFAQGSSPGGVITSEADIDDETADKLSRRWERFHKGLNNAHRVAVIGNGGKYQQTLISPDQVQLILTRGFTIKEIARWTGTPPHLLMDPSGSTSWGTGLEEQNRAWITYTLSRNSTPFEQAISDLLMDDNRYARWNYDALLRGSTLQRYQAYQFARISGFMSNNEIRAKEGMSPIDPLAEGEYAQPLNSNVAGESLKAGSTLEAEGAGDAATSDSGDTSDLQSQIDALAAKIAALTS